MIVHIQPHCSFFHLAAVTILYFPLFALIIPLLVYHPSLNRRLAEAASTLELSLGSNLSSLICELTLHWKALGLEGSGRTETMLSRALTEGLAIKLVAGQATWAVHSALHMVNDSGSSTSAARGDAGSTMARVASPPPIALECDVEAVLYDAVQAVSALAMEKHGVCPSFEVDVSALGSGPGRTSTGISCMPAHLYYILVEVLKNAAGLWP